MTERTPLDHERIRTAIRVRQIGIGAPLVYEAQVGSTSDVARDLAAAGSAHGTTVVADEQVAGRGRRGASRWHTPPCVSVAMSTVFRPVGVDPRLLGRFGLCIAVAVAEAIEASTGVRAKVKWPNDVVVEALNAAPGTICKVGGILIEPTIIATVPACVSHVVVGVGINVNLSAGAMAPVESDALPPIALIDVTGNAVSREELVIQILAATETAALGWADDVWPSWHTRYEARMVWLGGDVVVDADGDPVNRRSGRIVGVDGEGALVITVGSGSVVKIVSGNLRPSVSGLAS